MEQRSADLKIPANYTVLYNIEPILLTIVLPRIVANNTGSGFKFVAVAY